MFPRGVQLSAVGVGTGLLPSRGVPFNCPNLVGDAEGVVWRRGDGDAGDAGDAGDTGRRNGELRWEPYPSGEGLYPVGGRVYRMAGIIRCAQPLQLGRGGQNDDFAHHDVVAMVRSRQNQTVHTLRYVTSKPISDCGRNGDKSQKVMQLRNGTTHFPSVVSGG